MEKNLEDKTTGDPVSNPDEAVEASPESQTSLIEHSPTSDIILPPAPSYGHLDQTSEELDEERIKLAALYGKKNLLMKERTIQLQSKWWSQLADDLNSDDPTVRRFAMSEFNKIQIKLMPTTLANDTENPITPTLNNDERERISKSIDEIISFVRQQD